MAQTEQEKQAVITAELQGKTAKLLGLKEGARPYWKASGTEDQETAWLKGYRNGAN